MTSDEVCFSSPWSWRRFLASLRNENEFTTFPPSVPCPNSRKPEIQKWVQGPKWAPGEAGSGMRNRKVIKRRGNPPVFFFPFFLFSPLSCSQVVVVHSTQTLRKKVSSLIKGATVSKTVRNKPWYWLLFCFVFVLSVFLLQGLAQEDIHRKCVS